MGDSITLERLRGEFELREKEIGALLMASRAVLENRDFPATARIIFDHACELTGASSGYVALLSEDGHENEVLFLESGGLPCSVDPSLPMPIRGLRAEAYAKCDAVCDNDFMGSGWVRYLPEGHVAMRNVMFAPLVIDGKVEGIMGLANKDGDFTERDLEMATALGEFAAIALHNARTLDTLKETIGALKKALGEVKTLRGIIPICARCKKVRDEDGYWQEVDAYISEHSESDFSHGLCEECVEALYGDELDGQEQPTTKRWPPPER